jgi:5-methyltetrahydrofolate--homocysteine methyltransferase
MADLEKIAAGVVEGNQSKVEQLTKEAIDRGEVLEKIIFGGLVKGMDIVAEKWRKEEFFVPEVLVASRAMKAGMKLVTPLLSREVEKIGVFVIGTAKGDIHDIGKNLVALMLEAAGFRVIDLGVNVDKATFVQSAKDNKAQIVGISALLTTTMPFMKEVIDAFGTSEIRNKVKIMVGGAPVSDDYAQEIGADGYAQNAASTVEKAKQLIGSI